MVNSRSSKLLVLVLLGIFVASMNVQAAKRVRAARAKQSDAEAEGGRGPGVAKPAPGFKDGATSATKVTAPTDPVAMDVIKPFFGQKFEHGPATTPFIALSFDDGPSAKLTPQVLAILKKEGIKANFFMIGENVKSYPEMAKQVAAAGMEIGCHTMTHPILTRKSTEVVRQEIGGSQAIIEQVTGKKPFLFRAPGGNLNAMIRQTCAEDGMVIAGWSVDPRDWAPHSTPDSVFNTTMREMHGGAVVCIHDIHGKTVEALPRIIAALKAKGYVFTTISHLIAEEAKYKAAAPAAGGLSAGGGDSGNADAPAQPTAIPLDASGMK